MSRTCLHYTANLQVCQTDMIPNLAQRAPPKLTQPIGVPTSGRVFQTMLPIG